MIVKKVIIHKKSPEISANITNRKNDSGLLYLQTCKIDKSKTIFLGSVTCDHFAVAWICYCGVCIETIPGIFCVMTKVF